MAYSAMVCAKSIHQVRENKANRQICAKIESIKFLSIFYTQKIDCGHTFFHVVLLQTNCPSLHLQRSLTSHFNHRKKGNSELTIFERKIIKILLLFLIDTCPNDLDLPRKKVMDPNPEFKSNTYIFKGENEGLWCTRARLRPCLKPIS